MPKKARTRVNIKILNKEIQKNKHKMMKVELKRALRIVGDLRLGADAYQKQPALTPITTENAKSAYENGRMLTDKIATWVKKGFVAGPFNCPPVPGFRTNPLATVCRNGKIRPILNMSGPRGKSFNENIDEVKLEKVHMSTAKQFSYAVREAGVGAIFSKFDICDAYKLVPAKLEDFRLQGFKWLGKFFCETQECFGSKASVCNFDRLGSTKDLLVCLNSNTPRSCLYRVLDDTPCVSSADSDRTQKFSREMRSFCKKIDLPLANNCKNKEKAFENETNGVVLGIRFNSTDMTWSLPKNKADKVVKRCLDYTSAKHMDLEQTQKLMGSVNDLIQLCPVLRFHRGTGSRFLESFKDRTDILKQTTESMKEDMLVVAKVAEDARRGLPIAARPVKPVLSALTFYTDAAGAAFSMRNGTVEFHDQGERGVACLGGQKLEELWAACRLKWPEGLVNGKKDEKGVYYGHKSTFLECVGLLLPFLHCPEDVTGRDVIFKVDNRAVVQGWKKGYVKNDKSASEVVKALGYIALYYGSTVHVEHVPRVSDDMAELADELSRRNSSEKIEAKRLLLAVGLKEVDSVLGTWLVDPMGNNKLVDLLLEEAEGK